MKLAPKLTAVVAVVAVAVVVVVVVVAVVVVAVVTAAVAAVAAVAAAAVVTAAAVVVGTNNPVLSKKLDAHYWLFNNSGLKESRHRITPPFCLTKKAKKRSYRYAFFKEFFSSFSPLLKARIV